MDQWASTRRRAEAPTRLGQEVTLPSRAAKVTSGSAAERSPGSTFRSLSPRFAILRDHARSRPSRGDVSRRMRVPNVRAGPLVTHEPGLDLHSLQWDAHIRV